MNEATHAHIAPVAPLQRAMQDSFMLAACVCVVWPLCPSLLWLTANGVFLSRFFLLCLLFRSDSLVLAFHILISAHMPVRAATMDDYCCCDDVIG